MPFGFKAVSFRFLSFRAMPFHVVPLMPKATAGKSRIAAKTDLGKQSRARKVGGEWQIVATVQLEALKVIVVFEASVQPRDTSPRLEYLLSMLERNRTKQNETKRNETVNAVFLESCALLPFRFYGFLVKPNGIVLNDIGNVFLTRTVHACSSC